MATPKSSSSREPIRVAGKDPRPPSPLVSSPAEAEREKTKLRRGRERLEAEPTTDDTSVRSSLI